ncbi:MAG: NUDIX hydrolase, partial [Gammaproteobacteria bacterium]
EIFDVVNENDEVIGSADRREVHDRGLMHRAVHILVFDDSGRLLVQRRSFDKDCSPGLWDTSAGGHVECGEAYARAAVRELSEELGLRNPSALQFLLKLPAHEATAQEFVSVYKTTTAEIPILQESEVAAAKWVTIEELDIWIKRDRSQFTTAFLKICEEIGLM